MASIGKLENTCEVVPLFENLQQKEESQFYVSRNVKESAKAKEVAACEKKNRLWKFLKINKPLIPLKIAIFCWFASGAVMQQFIALYMVQMGLTRTELSAIYMILPAVQLFGPTVSGIVADKIGKSKPVLQANIIFALIAANGLLFIPAVKQSSCNGSSVKCHPTTQNNDSIATFCDIYANESHAAICTFNCSMEMPTKTNEYCFENYISTCYLPFLDHIFNNHTPHEHSLYNNTSEMCIEENSLHVNSSWCPGLLLMDCSLVCEANVNTTKEITSCQPQPDTGKTLRFILSLTFLISYHTFLTNGYRIFDVTARSMVETYNSDFGRERVWAILGAMLSSPVAGYIVSVISPSVGPKKYEVAFYMFDITVFVTLFVVWKLEVKIDPPAEGMIKKTSKLMRNPDILVFVLTIFVIGTSWALLRIFASLYITDLGGTPTLIGLLGSIGSLTGLPFLFTSDWFVKKIGSSNLLLLSLVGYIIWFFGYSFLINPWWALLYQNLEIVTYHLLWVSAVEYSNTISPAGLTATVIATAGGLHFGIGKGSASFIWMFIAKKYGGAMAFRVMGVICTATAISYALYQYFRKKNLQTRRQKSSLQHITYFQKPEILIMVSG